MSWDILIRASEESLPGNSGKPRSGSYWWAQVRHLPSLLISEEAGKKNNSQTREQSSALELTKMAVSGKGAAKTISELRKHPGLLEVSGWPHLNSAKEPSLSVVTLPRPMKPEI